jgi:hypothetical protein
MAYSDFDLPSVSERFGLTVEEGPDPFAGAPEIAPGESLRQTLAIWAPFAIAVNTEKARSEMIIAPILMEVVRLAEYRLSLFSGIPFEVDRDQGLNGTCDFLLARSPLHYFLRQPVVAVVEAKREDIAGSMGQCVAAMVGAQFFNARHKENGVPGILGVVTSGSNWHFIQLEGRKVKIDVAQYFYHSQISKILGILMALVP